jgi:hypothetical protein
MLRNHSDKARSGIWQTLSRSGATPARLPENAQILLLVDVYRILASRVLRSPAVAEINAGELVPVGTQGESSIRITTRTGSVAEAIAEVETEVHIARLVPGLPCQTSSFSEDSAKSLATLRNFRDVFRPSFLSLA